MGELSNSYRQPTRRGVFVQKPRVLAFPCTRPYVPYTSSLFTPLKHLHNVKCLLANQGVKRNGTRGPSTNHCYTLNVMLTSHVL